MGGEDAVTQEEAEQIKAAFKIADKNKDGLIAREDMGQIFKDLDDWSQEDLDELFDLAEKSADGRIRYTEFLNWILADRPGTGEAADFEGNEPGAALLKAGAPVAGDEDEDDGEAGNEDDLEARPPIVFEGLDMQQRFGLKEFMMVMRRLDFDDEEARDMYQNVASAIQARGEVVGEGPPLEEFLDDLQIGPDDLEALRDLAKIVAEVRTLVKSGQLDGADAGCTEKMTRILIDRVVRRLCLLEKPASEAWNVLSEGKVVLSKPLEALAQTFANKQDTLIKLVQQALVSPPFLPALAGQCLNRAKCIEAVDALIQDCRAKGVKFTDTSWDMTKGQDPEVFYVDKKAPGYDCTVATPAGFKRLSEMAPGLQLIKGGVHAGDIMQGQIGTCFLLGSLGAIAGNKADAIARIFIKYDIELGIYGVRFNLDGEWFYVIIDDYMPVDANGRLLYARCKDPQEAWVPLLEKAYCKFHLCYEMCDGGRPTDSIFALFGGASGKFTIQKKHKANPRAFFNVLQHAKERGWLLTTSFVQTAEALKASAGKCGEAVLPTGLVGGHVYSVLKVVEAYGQMLVCCRNPWGTGEWMGKWSDKNAYGEWTVQMKQATGYQGLNDGKFWMSIEDFVANSGGVEYARTFGPSWHKISHYSAFQSGAMKASALWPYQAGAPDEIDMKAGDKVEVAKTPPGGWWEGNVVGSTKRGFFPANYVKLDDRPVARFDLMGTPTKGAQGPMTVVVLLIQPNLLRQRKFYKRKKDGLNYKDTKYPSMQLVVVGPDGKVALRQQGKKQALSGELTLPGGGLWKVYALSSTGLGTQFTLRTYVKDGEATLKEMKGATLSEVPAE